MVKRILLPVDRSPRADAVAALVADTALGAHAKVRLLHVAPVPSAVQDPAGRIVIYADQELASVNSQGLDFLHALESHFPGVEVECVVRFGDPVTQILDEVDSFGADLVVVGTGGRSGIGRTLLGSVAEKVFDRATVPVMLVRPPAAV